MNDFITIHTATPDDAQAIVEVRRSTWLCTYTNEKAGITRKDIEDKINLQTLEEESERARKTIVENPSIKTFVAKDNDKVVGILVVIKGEEINRIGQLYVLSEYQGKGIGTQLMEKGLEWLGNDKDIEFEVATYNTNAINFYKKFGFVENGIGDNPVGQLPSGKKIPEIKMIKRIKEQD